MKRVLLFAGGDDRNFWFVQSIRQTLHSNTFLILAVVILVSDGLCALSLSRGHLSLMDLPGWNVMQLIFCSAGALIALSGCFMRKNRHKRSGGSLQHYLDFSPIEPGRLLTGILLSFTLYYIFFLLLVSPFLILALVHVKESREYLPIWIVCGYLIPLFLYFAGNSGKIRMEFLLFAFYTFFLLPGGDKDLSWLESGFFLTALLYCMVVFRSTLLPLSMEQAFAFRERFTRIGELHRDGTPSSIAAAEWMAAGIAGEILAGTNSGRNGSSTPVARLRALIDADRQFRKTLGELSREAAATPGHLRRLFLEKFQISPGEYRARRRLGRIMELIDRNELGLKEIAAEVGMRNVTHLHAFVRDRCGVTPGELQKQRGKLLSREEL